MKTNRIRSVESESDIVEAVANNSLLAGIILQDNSYNNWTDLPKHIQYTIRYIKKNRKKNKGKLFSLSEWT